MWKNFKETKICVFSRCEALKKNTESFVCGWELLCLRLIEQIFKNKRV